MARVLVRVGPEVHQRLGTLIEVMEAQVLQFSFTCLKSDAGNEDDSTVLPGMRRTNILRFFFDPNHLELGLETSSYERFDPDS